MLSRVVAAVRGVEMLRGLPTEGVERLVEQSRIRRFARDAVLIHQGDIVDAVHIILAGRVRVERAHEQLSERVELTERGRGEVVGESCALDGDPCPETATALVSTETLEVPVAALALAILQYPDGSGALLAALSGSMDSREELARQIWAQVVDLDRP